MRGKTKIGTSVFLLSILLASFFATFAVPTVSAQEGPQLRLSDIVNPLVNPGDTIVVNILFSNIENLWSVECKFTFDTDLLTPTGYFFTTGAPTEFRNPFVVDLNAEAGYVHLGASRPFWGGKACDYLGVADGETTAYDLHHGVIQPGSEVAVYRVINEFLGTAQTWYNPNTGLIEKRDPGPWMGGGGDGKVDRMPIIPSLASVNDPENVELSQGVERVYSSGALYASYGDPTDPRWITDYNTGYVKSSQVYEYRSRWPATGKIMTIDYATQDGVPAIASIDYAPSAGNGAVTFAEPPTLGEELFMQYRYRTGVSTDLPLLFASVIFDVKGRGVSPLHFEMSQLLDQYVPSNVIAHTAVDGIFDNRLEGTMSVPRIIDLALTPESYFDVYVSIGPWRDKPIDKMWGFQFILSFDPAILMPVDFEAVAVNDEGVPFTLGPSEIGADYVAVSANSEFGDPVGLTITEPTPVARIGFVVLDLGATMLDLHDTLIADVGGHNLIHETIDGSFANIGVGAALDTIFLQKRKFSKADGLMTLTAQVKNIEDGITRVRVKFTVFDPFGGVAAELTTLEARLPYGTTIRLSTELDLSGFLAPSSYEVQAKMQFLDVDGTWTDGLKGSPNAHRTTMVKSFTLLP